MRDDLMKEGLTFYQFAPSTKWVVKETSKRMEKIYLKCISCGKPRFPNEKAAKNILSGKSVQLCEVCSLGFYNLWEKVEQLLDPKKFWDEYNNLTYSFNYSEK